MDPKIGDAIQKAADDVNCLPLELFMDANLRPLGDLWKAHRPLPLGRFPDWKRHPVQHERERSHFKQSH